MNQSEDKNALVYLLAGFGLGALIGGLAGLLFAPKPGTETREQIGSKVKELKDKGEEWYREQKAKRLAHSESTEEVGA